MAKIAVNVSITDAVVREARALKVNLSQIMEEGLREHLKRRRAEKWQEENKEAIEHYNARIARDGLLSEEFSPF